MHNDDGMLRDDERKPRNVIKIAVIAFSIVELIVMIAILYKQTRG